VTVAGDVPDRSASSTIVARAAAAGSANTSPATRRSAPVKPDRPERTRTSAPSSCAS
jgi:hypothetical protein